MGMEISKTFPDRRGSVKWAEMQETNYTKKKFKMPSRKKNI